MQTVRNFESQLAESILKGNGQLALEKLATATLEKLMPRIEGKGELGNARWRIMYSPQIPSLISSGATGDTFEFLAGTDFEVQLGKRLEVMTIKLVYISKFCFFSRPGS